jgi:hypothetical protein
MRKGWVTLVVIVDSLATLSAQINQRSNSPRAERQRMGRKPRHPGKQERPATSPLRPMALAITAIR